MTHIFEFPNFIYNQIPELQNMHSALTEVSGNITENVTHLNLSNMQGDIFLYPETLHT